MKRILILLFVVLIVIWTLFFSRESYDWNEKIVLSNGEVVRVDIKYSNTHFWGHPHAISWGGDSPYYEVLIWYNSKKIRWKGSERPISINKNKSFFLITTKTYLDILESDLRYYKLNASLEKWQEINSKEIPKNIAFQNLFAHKAHTFGDYFNKVMMACYIDDVQIGESNNSETYYLWKNIYPQKNLKIKKNIEDIKRFISLNTKHDFYCDHVHAKQMPIFIKNINYEKKLSPEDIKRIFILLKNMSDHDLLVSTAKEIETLPDCHLSWMALDVLLKEKIIDHELVWPRIKKWIKEDSGCANYGFELALNFDEDFLYENFSFFESYLSKEYKQYFVMKIIQKIGVKAKKYVAKLKNLKSKVCSDEIEKEITLYRFGYLTKDDLINYISEDILDEDSYCKYYKMSLIQRVWPDVKAQKMKNVLEEFVKYEFQVLKYENEKLMALEILKMFDN